jgi:nucleotide-binding universal stress UspA family protein
VNPYSLDYEGVWLQGEAAKEILSFAQRSAMDIIVMGAFGHGRLHDLILGSTAAYVIRNSTIPILLHR